MSYEFKFFEDYCEFSSEVQELTVKTTEIPVVGSTEKLSKDLPYDCSNDNCRHNGTSKCFLFKKYF